MRIGRLQRDGLELAVYGAGDSGPALVFQHGLCGGAGQIAEAMQGLGSQRWQGLECRGHGASPLGDAVSIAKFADDVAAMIDAMGGPVVLGGISMGAAIAMRLAVTRPDLVRALILVRPAWVVDAAPENMAPNAEVGELLATLPSDQAQAIFAGGETARWLRDAAPDNLASLVGFFSRAPQRETARLLTTISADGPGITAADLRSLQVPTLICGCAEDAVHPMAHAQALTALIPHARLVELPAKARDKVAHLAALAAAMTLFLKEITYAPSTV
ncbi:alpha/beta hydrolase [Cypionkella aquatica]|uniref:Alpha/beta hydrolase n=1 Tax=Cypionkella aquatica TaxID=1756042 RepID=A0AA37U2D1_9RHOB|nr:alpha/beta hydrolase [Cypionkella aquatica]GLS88167.1 alpha/beta hydrolase [Cypionkella aquatica]